MTDKVHVDLKARLMAPPVPCGAGYTIATEDGMLRVLSIENPRQPKYVWEQRLPAAATAAPGVDGGVLWVPAGERLLAFRADNGQPLPLQQDRLDGAIRAAPFARAGRVELQNILPAGCVRDVDLRRVAGIIPVKNPPRDRIRRLPFQTADDVFKR